MKYTLFIATILLYLFLSFGFFFLYNNYDNIITEGLSKILACMTLFVMSQYIIDMIAFCYIKIKVRKLMKRKEIEHKLFL
jgi:hypothetical protein